jgi:hypothetical protein
MPSLFTQDSLYHRSYSLGGSIGQPDAGSMGGGSYQLNGGFWGGASINYNIYLPLVLKNF